VELLNNSGHGWFLRSGVLLRTVMLLRDHQTDHFTFWTAKQVKILKTHIEGRRQIYRPEEDILMPCRKKTPITTLVKNCVLDLLY